MTTLKMRNNKMNISSKMKINNNMKINKRIMLIMKIKQSHSKNNKTNK